MYTLYSLLFYLHNLDVSQGYYRFIINCLLLVRFVNFKSKPRTNYTIKKMSHAYFTLIIGTQLPRIFFTEFSVRARKTT